MKRAILTMLEENYDFAVNKGSIEFSCDIVEMMFVKREQRKGSFQIRNVSDTPMEGYIYSTDMRMRCLTTEFSSDCVDILYCFDSNGMEPSDVVKGDFQIISNKGEYTLSFEVHMEQDYLYSSMGHIKNLFHFANLAKTAWDEAVLLYYSNNFIELLRGNGARYKSIYRGLSNQVGNQQNVDEFLVAIKKKSPIEYSVDLKEVRIDEPPACVRREITITRNGWGYSSIKAAFDGEFLRLEKECYTEDDFLGNTCRVPFYIEPQLLHKGRNFGKITLSDLSGETDIFVIVEKNVTLPAESESHNWKKLTDEVMRAYILFRLGKIDTISWIKQSEDIVEKMTGQEEKNIIARLYQVQLLLAAERILDAKFILERVQELMTEEKQSAEIYAYYLYLTTLVDREDDYIDKVAHKVKKLYHKQPENRRLAWLMLYLQEDLYYNPAKKWDFLEEQYNMGANSPILYTEALPLLLDNPSLMLKLGDYEMSLLGFAIKNDILNKEAVERIQFLSGREREFSQKLYCVLCKCYERIPTRELLQAVCTFLMKGNRTSNEYFKWYQMAVEQDIRLTRLFDFYMLSVPTDSEFDLPKMVLMYFSYQSNLDYEHMAFLYANVLKQRAKYPEIALSYAEHIEKFVREQLQKGRINEHLCYLYQNVVTPAIMDVKLANDFAPMLFMNEVSINDERIKNIILIHDKSIGEKSFPVVKGKVYVPIYSAEYQILLEDENGFRFVPKETPAVKPVLFSDKLLETILPMADEKIGLVLYQCENKRNYVHITEENVYGFARLLGSDRITFSYKKEILVNLVKFYFEKDYIRELDELLLEVKPEILDASERSDFIKILVARGMYDTAFEWLYTYGPEHVENKTILRLCSRLLEKTDFEQESRMLAITSFIYRLGKYDQNILFYLVSYFDGNTREMRNLLHAADSFAVDSYPLLEKLMIQMLFTGTYIGERMNLYEDYVHKNGSLSVEKAFLSQCAYDFFVNEGLTDEKIFERLEQLLFEGEEVNRVSRLAVLKHYSQMDEEKWNEGLIRDLVSREIVKGAIFPFFRVFAQKIPQLLIYTDKSFVEYKGSPKSRVLIHYAVEHEDGSETEYRKEEMDNLYGGIFVKSFVLFVGESIQYYITEESDNREQLTQSSVLLRSEEEDNIGEWKYPLLNEIVLSKELKDEMTYEQLLNEYEKKNFLVRYIFQSSVK